MPMIQGSSYLKRRILDVYDAEVPDTDVDRAITLTVRTVDGSDRIRNMDDHLLHRNEKFLVVIDECKI